MASGVVSRPRGRTFYTLAANFLLRLGTWEQRVDHIVDSRTIVNVMFSSIAPVPHGRCCPFAMELADYRRFTHIDRAALERSP